MTDARNLNGKLVALLKADLSLKPDESLAREDYLTDEETTSIISALESSSTREGEALARFIDHAAKVIKTVREFDAGENYFHQKAIFKDEAVAAIKGIKLAGIDAETKAEGSS